ncbi:MAG TPA: M90 family metallopeptidase, partial [Gemmatales bacterium]|nr:M90 family metallopeptidase [Gemmatales bacterium]
YHQLTPILQNKLRRTTRVLMAEKRWEGCAGLEITTEIQIVVASHAALLLLYIDHDYFSMVPTILVYPRSFATAKADDHSEEEFVPDKAAEGQAVYRGPVILAWEEVLHDAQFPAEGENVVIHEFAHQLDFLDLSVDGVPLLNSVSARNSWKTTISLALEQHRLELVKAKKSLFPAAAAENATEFFAYATEAYYTRPLELLSTYPVVFELLRSFYKLNTASIPWRF